VNRLLAVGILALVFLLSLSACVSPSPPVHHFVVEAAAGGPIANQAAGVPFNIKITAQDSNNKTVTSFSGKVNITSTGTLSAGGGTSAAFVNGILASHSVTISNQGSFTITATRTGGSETGSSNAFAVDAAPSVTSTTPANTATGVPLVSGITINFSESVNATTNSFALECPSGTPKAFTLSASPANSFTLTPTGGLPSATTCRVQVIAAQVSDVDTNDPPNNMAADYSFSFTTAAASTLTSTIAANPTSITANGTATSAITVQLKDSVGNNLTSSGGTVALSTTAGTLSAVSDNNNGTYTATLTAPTTTGTATLSGTLDGTPLSNTTTVDFVPGPLQHFAVEAQGGGNIGNQATGTPFNIRVTAQDANNNTVTSFTGTVDITSTGTLSAGSGTTAAFTNGVLASHSLTISNTGSFTITATRTGGTEAGSSNSFSVTADAPPTAVNDSASVNEDSGANTLNVLANDTDPDGGTKSIASVTQPANGTVAITNSGADLTYTPNANYCNNPPGTTPDTFTYTLTPGGSSATVSVSVTCINDVPSFTKGADQTVNEDAGAQTVNGWATATSPGPANESGQTVSFLVSNNNNGLFSAQPAVSPTGVLTYTPAPNQNGSATVSVQIKDNGGTANGGVDTSAVQTFTITVNAVNDPPVAQTKTTSAQANMKVLGVNPGLLSGVTDPDSGINGCTPTFSVASITANSGGTVSNVSLAAGTFDFEPNPGFTGTAVVNYTVSDNGCPGSATSAPAAINITVSGPVIWFVNAASVTNGTGTLNSPFNTLAAANAVDAANHRIFVYSGTTPTASITLNSNEWLIGQGVTGTTFDALFGITPPAGTIARPSLGGTRPTIQGNVAMASSSAVRGLNIQPASGTAGLTASGASSLTVGEVSVNTVNAAAVNLSNSGGTLSLTSVSANGGSNGIVLNNTSGSFSVTGSGGTCTEANPTGCTGGVIQNMTGVDDSSATPVGTGIVLNNAQGVSFTRMYIHDHSNYAIRGTSVNGFTLDTSVVSGANGTNEATPFNDGSLIFQGVTGVSSGMTGTSSITNSVIRGGWQRNITIDNSVGTLNLTVTNNTIKRTSDAAGDDGLLIEADTNANVTVNISNNTFARHGGDHINLSLVNNAVMNTTISNNTLQGNYTGAPEGNHPIGLGQGIFIFGANFGGTFTYNISGNTVVGNNQGGAINVNKGSGSGTFSGRVENNTIGISGLALSGSQQASGIIIGARGSGSHTTLVNNNTVQQYYDMGINIDGAEDAAVTLNATVTNNTIREPGSAANTLHGLHLNWGVTAAGNGSVACVDIRNNNGDTGGNEAGGGFDYRLRQRMLTTVRLPGYTGAAGDNTAVQTFIAAQNNGSETVLASNNVAGGAAGFIGGAACPQP